jgi:tetrahydromethanopterin S-methyltransferase subunit G
MIMMDFAKELTELKRRVELAETRLAQIDGRFGFISEQLRDVQLYLHAKFAHLDGRLDTIEQKVDALPRAIAEMVTSRS